MYEIIQSDGLSNAGFIAVTGMIDIISTQL